MASSSPPTTRRVLSTRFPVRELITCDRTTQSPGPTSLIPEGIRAAFFFLFLFSFGFRFRFFAMGLSSRVWGGARLPPTKVVDHGVQGEDRALGERPAPPQPPLADLTRAVRSRRGPPPGRGGEDRPAEAGQAAPMTAGPQLSECCGRGSLQS